MDWSEVSDSAFIYAETDRLKAISDTLFKNLMVDRDTIDKWIRWGQLYCSVSEKAVFFLRKSGEYAHVYYIATDESSIANGLSDLAKGDMPVCIDYVTKSDQYEDIFAKNGFELYSTLLHMSVISNGGEDKEPIYGEYAVMKDVDELREILKETMDPADSDIPEDAEIREYIDQRSVLVDRDEQTGRIVACVLFTRAGGRLHLNYYAKNPLFSDRSAKDILHSYWYVNGGAKRKTVFVRETNQIARHIYEREGMCYDGLKCFVFCNR